MSEQKQYANGISGKEINFSDGSKLTLDINKEKFIEWLRAQSEKFVKVDMLKRREPSQYGETHYAVKNTFKPKGDNKPSVDLDQDEQDSSLPF